MEISFDHQELAGSPRVEINDTGVRVTREIKCAWADRFNVAKLFLGGTINGAIVQPIQYTDYPGVYCRDVSITPFHEHPTNSTDARIADYEHAKLTVNFSSPEPYSTEDPNRLISERFKGAAEFMSVERDQLYWVYNGTPSKPLTADESPGLLIRMLDWSYTRHLVFSLPQTIASLMGMVNESTIVSPSLGLAFAPETLLYQPPSIERVFTAQGQLAWNLSLRFTHRPGGWNKFWRSETQTFERIKKPNGENYLLYQLANLSSLIANGGS